MKIFIFKDKETEDKDNSENIYMQLIWAETRAPPMVNIEVIPRQ